MDRANGEQPQDLVRMRQHLDEFRGGSSPGKPLPGWVWSAAARLARRYGVHRTGRALGLEYNKLKRLSGGVVAATADAAGSDRRRAASGAVKFVDVTGALPPSGECRLVLQGPGGQRLRLEMAPGAATELLLGLCRAGFVAQ